jgi:hypothetical protein
MLDIPVLVRKEMSYDDNNELTLTIISKAYEHSINRSSPEEGYSPVTLNRYTYNQWYHGDSLHSNAALSFVVICKTATSQRSDIYQVLSSGISTHNMKFNAMTTQ